MIIHSQYKDYYDYVAHLYGGGDPSILYMRHRLVPLNEFNHPGALELQQKGLKYVPWSTPHDDVHFKWLAVCGKQYLLVSEHAFGEVANYKILSHEAHPKVWETLSKKRRWSNEHSSPLDYVGVTSSAVVELSKKVGAPVFIYTFYRRDDGGVTVAGEIPILVDLGLARLVPAQTLYQDLSYFMGNTIKDSPDMMPATKMSDKEKISQHGFDLKQSFRHRV